MIFIESFIEPLYKSLRNLFIEPCTVFTLINYFKWFIPSSEDMNLATQLILFMALIWYLNSKKCQKYHMVNIKKEFLFPWSHQISNPPHSQKYRIFIFFKNKPDKNIQKCTLLVRFRFSLFVCPRVSLSLLSSRFYRLHFFS